MNWLEFWNQDTSLYVNARHRRAHYDLVARDLARRTLTVPDDLMFRRRAGVLSTTGVATP